MSKPVIFLDSFTGLAADLPKRQRTTENVLLALTKDPTVSVWDMSEYRWLRDCIGELKESGHIEDVPEPYPWLRFKVLQEKTNG